MQDPHIQTNQALTLRLDQLETLLRQKIIERISNQELKNTLLARLNQDKKIIVQASLDSLNDARETVLLDPLGEKNRGLNDRQDKTRILFATQLKGHDAANEINHTLAQLCDVRSRMLQQHCQEKNLLERAYQSLSRYMGRIPAQGSTTHSKFINKVDFSEVDLEEANNNVLVSSPRNGR